MKRSWISCNLAISGDGKISSTDHRPSNWTSRQDHQRLKDLRLGADALMVGRGTAETDRMTMKVEGDGPQPLRCIVSRHGEMSADHPLFTSDGGQIHLLATQGYRGHHPERVIIHEASLSSFLETLHRDFNVSRLHCEGGGQLIRELAQLDAIDEIHLTFAGHTLLGGANSPTTTGLVAEYLADSRAFELTRFEPVTATGECFLSYQRREA